MSQRFSDIDAQPQIRPKFWTKFGKADTIKARSFQITCSLSPSPHFSCWLATFPDHIPASNRPQHSYTERSDV